MHMESSVSPGYFNSLQIYEPLLRSAQWLRVMREIVSSVYEVWKNRPNHHKTVLKDILLYSLNLKEVKP